MVVLKREWPALLGILVFCFVLMWPFFVNGADMLPSTWMKMHPWARATETYANPSTIVDPLKEFDPWFRYTQEALKEGRIAHWNPWQFCGTPLYANRLVPLFYPPFFLTLLFSAPNKILGWFQFFNLIIASLGMYLLLRRWRLSPSASAVTSCIYLTTGLNFMSYPVWTLGIVGFPWLMWALDGFLERPGLRSISIAALIVGTILTVGYPICVVHLTYLVAIYLIARVWFMGAGKDHWRPGIRWAVPLVVLAVVYVLGIGVSAIANLPLYVYGQHSQRDVAGFNDPFYEELCNDPAAVREIADEWRGNIGMVIPMKTRIRWFGGVLVYFLGFLGLLTERRKPILLGILGLLFYLPIWIPEVYWLTLKFLPGWGLTPTAPVHVVNMAAVMAAGFGIEALLRIKGSDTVSPGVLGKFILLAFAAIVTSLAWIVPRDTPDGNLVLYNSFYNSFPYGIGILTALVVFAIFHQRLGQIFRWTLVIALIGFSIHTNWFQQNLYSPPGSPPPTPFTDWFEEYVEESRDGSGSGRLAHLAYKETDKVYLRAQNLFAQNMNVHYSIPDIGGYDSLVSWRYVEYTKLIQENGFDLCSRMFPAVSDHRKFREQYFRALAVKWIICKGPLPLEARQGLSLIWDDRRDDPRPDWDNNHPDEFIQVWELNDPLPRAFLSRRVSFADNPEHGLLNEICRVKGIHPEAVIIEDPERENESMPWPEDIENFMKGSGNYGEVIFETDDPEYIRLNVTAPEEAYLILRDNWYPEWEAWIDGEAVEIYPADLAFRAVGVPEGDCVVEFRFVPRSFITGSWITIAFLVILFLMGLTRIPAGKQSV